MRAWLMLLVNNIQHGLIIAPGTGLVTMILIPDFEQMCAMESGHTEHAYNMQLRAITASHTKLHAWTPFM